MHYESLETRNLLTTFAPFDGAESVQHVRVSADAYSDIAVLDTYVESGDGNRKEWYVLKIYHGSPDGLSEDNVDFYELNYVKGDHYVFLLPTKTNEQPHIRINDSKGVVVDEYFGTPEWKTPASDVEPLGLYDEPLDLNGDGLLDLIVESRVELSSRPQADFDRSGEVDFADFLNLAFNFGTDGHFGNHAGDADLSGTVDFEDFLILSDSFGEQTKPAVMRSCFHFDADPSLDVMTWYGDGTLLVDDLQIELDNVYKFESGELVALEGEIFAPRLSASGLSYTTQQDDGTLWRTSFIQYVREGRPLNFWADPADFVLATEDTLISEYDGLADLVVDAGDCLV